jgi:hypothetical protein
LTCYREQAERVLSPQALDHGGCQGGAPSLADRHKPWFGTLVNLP